MPKSNQVSIDGSSLHRVQYMNALRLAVERKHISRYQADELRRSYDNHE